MKQNCRNVLASKPELLPVFFLLGVKDALSYDASTNDGGLNGSIKFELDKSYNADLKDAVDALKEVRTIQREQMVSRLFDFILTRNLTSKIRVLLIPSLLRALLLLK